ncbi:ABC transporter permease [Candidatus Woesearchaeota archaeon]|nr:ABC transporter permease [Candidatus Woesearchaeota archaeon]
MRFTSIIKKNFKLLLRSKSSAFILLAGPILIILIVGLFFNGKSAYDLSLGYCAPVPNDLTRSFISSLEKNGFVVYDFNNESSCTDKIKQGVIHTCILFPQDFKVSNDQSTELRFIVDYSRVNLVYKVIDAVSEIIEFETREVSYSLTNTLISRIDSTLSGLEKQEELEERISGLEVDISKDFDSLKSGVDSIDFSTGSVSLRSLRSKLGNSQDSLDDLIVKYGEFSEYSYEMLDELEGYLDSNKSDEIRAELDLMSQEVASLQNASLDDLNASLQELSDADERLTGLFERLQENERLADSVKKIVSRTEEHLSSFRDSLSSLSKGTSGMRERLEEIDITRAESIVSPVNTKIEPLMSESSNFQFAFPFLVILLVMFASLMISSTLIIFERSSRAVFRNFMTPIDRKMFISAHFLTVLLIVLLQSLLILLISYLAMKFALFSSILSVVAVIFVASVFFIALGLMIGFVFASQEGAMMASLVLGSTFLFISNLVVPLESISQGLAGIIRFNPFIIFSEFLRKALLFNLPLSDAVLELSILLLIALVILVPALLGRNVFHDAKRYWVKRKGKRPENKLRGNADKDWLDDL